MRLIRTLGAGWLSAALLTGICGAATVSPNNTASKAAMPAKPGGKPSYLNGIRETVLPNGLTVLTREVHTAPVAYFSVWYKVGSVNEQVGQTGMSHLMEHMMFKGTTTRGPGIISSTLQNNGAEFNANTSFDRTSYFETLASDRLELAMQIESDRMENSLFDEAQHQKEMTVVRSEYEAGENNPGTALSKAVRLAANQVHPYRWMPIGFRSDIENFSRDEMYAYYKNYYSPNNATIVMVGDFDTAQALVMVNKYFGALPAHSIAKHFITREPAQEGERRVTVRRAGTQPQIQIAYHIPAFGNPDRYVLDVMETVLSGGRIARFFRNLVQTGLAASAEANDYGLRDPDLFFVDATAQPGHTNAELEKALLDEIEKLQTTPISQEELNVALNQAEASYIYGKDSVESQGRELGENAMRGDWRFGETYLLNLKKVTPAEVQRVAQKYLTARNRTVGYFEPITEATAAATAATPLPPVASTPPPAITPTITPSKAAIGTAMSASTKPKRVVLGNGLVLVVQENHANATVSLNGALIGTGGTFDPPNKPGLASFTSSLLSRGTESRSLQDIARGLESIGATATLRDRGEYLSLSGHSLSRDFNTVLDILSDELKHPTLPAEEIERLRGQSLAFIQRNRQNTSELASIALNNALYPAGHPYHEATIDEQAAYVKALTRDDVVDYYTNHYGPNRLVLTIVGDIKSDDAIAAVTKYFGDWPAKAGLANPVAIPDTPLPKGAPQPIIIPVPDKAQVDVRFGYPGLLKRGDPEFYRVVVMNTILGGGTGLTSRLARRVRDQEGLVYGIYAQTLASLGEGPFEVQFGANPANTDKAIDETLKQVEYLRKAGVTPQEVQQAIAFITGSYPVTLSTNNAVGSQLLIAEMFHLGPDYIQKRNGYYRAVTRQQVNAAIKKYMHPDLGALVIAGTYKGKYSH